MRQKEANCGEISAQPKHNNGHASADRFVLKSQPCRVFNYVVFVKNEIRQWIVDEIVESKNMVQVYEVG